MSKTCRDLRAFSKFSWTEMICVKKLTFCNSAIWKISEKRKKCKSEFGRKLFGGTFYDDTYVFRGWFDSWLWNENLVIHAIPEDKFGHKSQNVREKIENKERSFVKLILPTHLLSCPQSRRAGFLLASG